MNDPVIPPPAGSGDESLQAPATPTLQDLHEELAASTLENRRSTRRTLDVLREVGSAVSALSALVEDLHAASRTATATTAADEKAASSRGAALPFIDLHDRLSRLTGAFSRPPGPRTSWWPGASAALGAWADAWQAQHEAVDILRSHVESLIDRMGVRRLPTVGQPFDPAVMIAVDTRAGTAVSDHSVVEEHLSAWRHEPTGTVVRPAHVVVARSNG